MHIRDSGVNKNHRTNSKSCVNCWTFKLQMSAIANYDNKKNPLEKMKEDGWKE